MSATTVIPIKLPRHTMRVKNKRHVNDPSLRKKGEANKSKHHNNNYGSWDLTARLPFTTCNQPLQRNVVDIFFKRHDLMLMDLHQQRLFLG